MRQDERRRDHREKKYKQHMEQYLKGRPKIQQQFSDLKRPLANVTEEEWAAIPDVGDARNKSKRNPRADKWVSPLCHLYFCRYTPISDSLIASAMSFGQVSSVLDQDVQSGLASSIGTQSSLGAGPSGFLTGIKTTVGSSTELDLQRIGQARKGIMDIRLKGVSYFFL